MVKIWITFFILVGVFQLNARTSSDEQLLNNFAYGSQTGVTIHSGKVNIFNFGTDNLAKEGNSLRIMGGEVKAMNVMRYNGSTVSGTITGLYNEMYIGENEAKRSR